LGSLRFGIATGYFEKNCPPQARSAVAAVASALNGARRIEIPETACARARTAAYLITMAEGAQLHLPRIKERARDFDPNTRDRFVAGALLPAAWYLHAQRYRSWWREQMREVFRHVDVLLAPATPVSATAIGQETMTLEGVEMLVRPNIGIFTQPISFVGLPVVAAPVHSTGPMPIGVQLIGAPWSEPMLLRVARALEKSGVCSAPIATLAA
jgi:Asp-tRNA(Asn)/Glu-tRNA(Gln) amidotransferase A subunit family amidase